MINGLDDTISAIGKSFILQLVQPVAKPEMADGSLERKRERKREREGEGERVRAARAEDTQLYVKKL